MKIYFLAALLLMALAAVIGAPSDNTETKSVELQPAEEQDGGKLKISCNWGEGICGTRCIAIGKHGGRCIDGVCHCIQ